jgi:hypothetical protein
MAPVRKEQDFIDHGLDPDFNRSYSIFLEQGEGLFIQGIGSGGDPNGIDQTRSDEGLSLFQITNLIIPMDGRETSAIEGNLFFSVLLVERDLDQRDLNKMMNGSRRGKPFVRGLLIAEETTAKATHRGKKNRED